MDSVSSLLKKISFFAGNVVRFELSCLPTFYRNIRICGTESRRSEIMTVRVDYYCYFNWLNCHLRWPPFSLSSRLSRPNHRRRLLLRHLVGHLLQLFDIRRDMINVHGNKKQKKKRTKWDWIDERMKSENSCTRQWHGYLCFARDQPIISVCHADECKWYSMAVVIVRAACADSHTIAQLFERETRAGKRSERRRSRQHARNSDYVPTHYYYYLMQNAIYIPKCT